MGGVLFDSITGALGAGNLGGTIAKAAAPFVAQQIGEYFKKEDPNGKDKQGTPAHLLAHAILGAAVAAANGDNPLAGGISAAGAEGAAPLLSKWLFKEDDPSKLTAEQKSTISSILGLAGNVIGGVIGGDNNVITGAYGARNAVNNNSFLINIDKFPKDEITVSIELRPQNRGQQLETTLKEAAAKIRKQYPFLSESMLIEYLRTFTIGGQQKGQQISEDALQLDANDGKSITITIRGDKVAELHEKTYAKFIDELIYGGFKRGFGDDSIKMKIAGLFDNVLDIFDIDSTYPSKDNKILTAIDGILGTGTSKSIVGATKTPEELSGDARKAVVGTLRGIIDSIRLGNGSFHAIYDKDDPLETRVNNVLKDAQRIALLRVIASIAGDNGGTAGGTSGGKTPPLLGDGDKTGNELEKPGNPSSGGDKSTNPSDGTGLVKPGSPQSTAPLKPQNAYLRGQEHGVNWQPSDAINRAKKTDTPQGKWGSRNDLEYAGKMAATLPPDKTFVDFPINSDSKSIVYYKDGSTSKPDMIRVRNDGNGKFHGFPIDSKTAGPINDRKE